MAIFADLFVPTRRFRPGAPRNPAPPPTPGKSRPPRGGCTANGRTRGSSPPRGRRRSRSRTPPAVGRRSVARDFIRHQSGVHRSAAIGAGDGGGCWPAR
jgi:hypothetical protein